MKIMSKKIKKELLKFKNIEIIYATEKQYWGIAKGGLKKKICLEVFNIFLKNKYLISYKDSKLIKKGVNFKLVVKGIEVYLKNTIKIIEVLVETSLITDMNVKNKCLGFTKRGSQCNRFILSNYCFQHKNCLVNKNIELIRQDCFLYLPNIKSNTIDAIISDLPYNLTKNFWDVKLNLKKIWEVFLRVLKNDGVIILTATIKFASQLIQSNLKMFKYDIIWVKSVGSNQLNIKHQPLRKHELILIFYTKLKTYNEQLGIGLPYEINRSVSKEQGFGAQKPTSKKNNGFRHATSVLNIANPRIKNGHPTEKPLELMEYLVKTYTNKGDLVLDPFMGCGSTGLACKNLSRRFIGVEKDIKYYDIAFNKINGVLKNL